MQQGQRPSAASRPQQTAPKALLVGILLEARLPSDYPVVTVLQASWTVFPILEEFTMALPILLFGD